MTKKDAVIVYGAGISGRGAAQVLADKKQQVYLSLAKAYGAQEDYENAGAVLDEAIEKKLTTDETDMEQF